MHPTVIIRGIYQALEDAIEVLIIPFFLFFSFFLKNFYY